MLEHSFSTLPDYDPTAPPRRWLPSPEQLVADCVESIDGGELKGLRQLATQCAAPFVDLSTTALTSRATLMAADHGRAFYHHELRRRIPMPPGLEPEVSVWEAGTVPLWSDGVLAEPKYFSFFQDAPFPAYNPNHRRKWRAHELLHGASRFFWHPRMTRFEFYVSARLNELLPVIHWYHLDEIFRPRCDDHIDQVLHRDHCLKCQAAAHPYWESSAPQRPERVDAAHQWVDSAWSHLEEEWDAIAAEIETGRPKATPRPRLDASSDAIGYMRAHWNRVTAWSFGRWVETFLVDGVDYFSTLPALQSHVGQCLHELVGGNLSIALSDHRARRARSQLQDLGYRVLLALEWLDPEGDDARRAEEMLLPALDDGAALAHQLLDDPTVVDEALDQFARTCQVFSQVAPRFPDEVTDAFLGFGYRFIDPRVFGDAATGQLFSGLEDGLPNTMETLDEPIETTRRFAYSKTFDELGRLGGRFARWLDGEHKGNEDSPLDAEVVERARFEAFVNAEPRRDDEATHFASLPEHASELRDRPGQLRPHATLRRDRFRADVVASLTGAELDDRPLIPVAASIVDGELRLIVEDESATAVLDHLSANRPLDQWWDFALADAIMHLLHHSLITWLPAPESASRN